MHKIVGPFACILTFVSGGAHATDDASALVSRLTDLRDAFVSQIKAEGFRPRLPPPAIVLDNPPSYGRYENDENVVHIAAWSALSEEQQARFARLATLLNNGRSPEQAFEDSVHHWVIRARTRPLVARLLHFLEASQSYGLVAHSGQLCVPIQPGSMRTKPSFS